MPLLIPVPQCGPLCYVFASGRTGTRNQPKKWVEGKLNKAFSHFPPIFFAIFDDFFKFQNAFGTFYIEKLSNMAKKEEKPWSTFNPFLHSTAGKF